MSNARNLSNLLEAGGDVKLSSLDNAPAPSKSTIDALGIAATSVTGSQASAITANSAKVTNYNQTKADIDALGVNATSLTGSQATAITAALPKAGGTMTGDIALGDNVKAKFGAGAELQIYSNGTHSYISESGTGNLLLLGDNFEVNNAANTQNKITATTGGAVTLHNAGATKLATTSTGIDVTGSVTCDGFTSTGIDDNATSTAITIDSSENVGVGDAVPNARLHVEENNNWSATTDFRTSGNLLNLVNINSTNGTVASLRLATGTAEGDAYLFQNKFIANNNTELQINRQDSGVEGITKELTIDNAHNIHVETGNLVIGTAGKGIDFSATSDATSMSSEILDDYEEGTWTPVFGGGTASNLTGFYTKIGNQVTVFLNLTNGTIGSASGDTITGLPYASPQRSATSALNYYNLFAYDNVQGLVNTSSTAIVFLHNRVNAPWESAPFSNGNNRYLHCTATYKVS